MINNLHLTLHNSAARQMLGVHKETWNLSERDCERKPRHVKKLNFGQSNLRATTVDKLLNQNVNKKHPALAEERPGIPCMRKDDLVKKWLASHVENEPSNLPEGLSTSPPLLSPSSSSILPTYVNHLSESPVLGNRSGRRAKAPPSFQMNITREDNQAFLTRAETAQCIDKENVFEEFSNGATTLTPTSIDSKNSQQTTSPVLGKVTSIHTRKRKNRETGAYSVHSLIHPSRSPVITASYVSRGKTKGTLEGKRCASETATKRARTDANINALELIYNLSNQLTQGSRFPFYEPGRLRCSRISQGSSGLYPLKAESDVTKVHALRSSKESLQIETSSSDDDAQKNSHQKLNEYSDSERTVSDFIEDEESQHVVELQYSRTLTLTCMHRDATSEACTTCKGNACRDVRSSAEHVMQASPEAHIFEEISQPTSSSSKHTDGYPNRTDLEIRQPTSPPRATPHVLICTSLLDSGKKRRKPKRGSLVARLQLLIRRERSFLRIWQHQAKQAELEKTSAPHILFRIEKYLIRFNKYFLEGPVKGDSFNLLPNVLQSTLSKEDSALKRNDLDHWIAIIVVPEIMGRLSINRGNMLKIYPPWDVVDLPGIVLIARRISIQSGGVDINGQCQRQARTGVKIIEEHLCSCIKENSPVPNCIALHNDVKPNVITHILKV